MGFDIVAIDECLFTMMQFTSTDTSSASEHLQNLIVLSILLRNSRSCIFLQHRITDECIGFYQSLARAKSITRVKVEAQTRLIPVKYANTRADLVRAKLFVAKFLIDNTTRDGLSKPFILFTNSKEFAVMMYFFLCSLHRYTGRHARILLLTGDTSGMADQKRFVASPGTEYDVVITTPTIQVGVSRLRWREDMMPHKYAWWQPGATATMGCEYAALKEVEIGKVALEQAEDQLTGSAGLRYTTAKIAAIRDSERNDTFNRHDYLHVREYRMSNVEHVKWELPDAVEYGDGCPTAKDLSALAKELDTTVLENILADKRHPRHPMSIPRDSINGLIKSRGDFPLIAGLYPVGPVDVRSSQYLLNSCAFIPADSR